MKVREPLPRYVAVLLMKSDFNVENQMTSITYAPNALDSKTLRRLRSFYRTAMACALLPMLVGITILLLFWATLHDRLILIGFFFIPVGLCFFLVGFAMAVTCLVYLRKALRANLTPPFSTRRIVLAFLLLFTNFPLAFGCAAAGLIIMRICYIDVVNETPAALDSCVVAVPGESEEVRNLAPGAFFRARVSPRSDGVAEVRIVQAGRSETTVAIPYVSDGGGGDHMRVRIQPDLTGKVERLR